MSRKLFRVQDHHGRGPYRPGFSRQWADDDGPDNPPWWVELGLSLQQGLAKCRADRFGGSAFSSMAQLERWFTPTERTRLDGHGFHIVRFRPDYIIAETPTQVLFEQNTPLAGLPFYARLARAEAA